MLIWPNLTWPDLVSYSFEAKIWQPIQLFDVTVTWPDLVHIWNLAHIYARYSFEAIRNFASLSRRVSELLLKTKGEQINAPQLLEGYRNSYCETGLQNEFNVVIISIHVCIGELFWVVGNVLFGEMSSEYVPYSRWNIVSLWTEAAGTRRLDPDRLKSHAGSVADRCGRVVIPASRRHLWVKCCQVHFAHLILHRICIV